MRFPSTRWWARFAVGLLWTPVAAEMFLRTLAPVPMLPRYIQAGPLGIRENMPNQTYRHQTPEYTVEIRTNSIGLRADQEFTKTKPEGTKRIVVLGDSFGMGYGVNIEDSSLGVLERKLEDRTGCEIEILNFSVSGFGPAEELLVLEGIALDYEPDLVIQYYYTNDPTDDLRANLFALEDGELVRASPSYLPAVKTREFLFSFAAYRWLAGESHLYNLARDRAGGLAKQWLAQVRSLLKATTTEPPASDSNQDADRPVGPSPAQKLTLATLARMQDSAEAGGTEFLVMSIPVRQARDRFRDSFPFELNHDLPVISPIEQFRSAGGEMLYWERSHGHWTPLGCRLVAETVLEHILKEGLLGSDCD